MAERPAAPRPTSTGVGRVLIAVYAVFATAATGRSLVQLGTQADKAPFPYVLSAAAAVIYVAATLGLARDGHRWRRLAWAACGVELAGVLLVGTLSLLQRGWFPDDTVWSVYGRGYAFFPLALPFVGLAWLARTR